MTHKKAGKGGLERKRSLAGFLFVLPWVIGFWGFFLRPLLSSALYSVSDISILTDGVYLQYKGFDAYYDAFFTDLYFVQRLTAQLGTMLWQVPVIVAFSLFMAVIMNGKFKGRGLVRTVFFLPVIVGSGVVMSIMNGDAISNAIASGTRSSMLFQTSGIDAILLDFGIGRELVNALMGIIDGIFTLAWKSGLQILLFMSGLLSISGSLYESARVEGATKWDMFWKITFPMISPVLILNVIYTIIDNFADYSNTVMQYIYTFVKSLNLGYSSALSMITFVIMMTIIGIAYVIINKRVVYAVQ